MLHNEKYKVYRITGQLFFASVEDFLAGFDQNVSNENIVIDFSSAHIWDDSAVGAIDTVMMKYRDNNNQVEIIGLNKSSKKIVEQLAISDL